MAEIPHIRIGHLKITDHLILGITADKLARAEENFDHCKLEPIPMTSWNQVVDALTDGQIEGAFMLAPTAMDLFKSGVDIRLILLTHKGGSSLIVNNHTDIEDIDDFKGKVVLIPYQLSVHHILFHRILSQNGLKPGASTDPAVDVILEVMAPSMMPEAIQYDEEGEIGGFIVAEPIGTQAIESNLGTLFCSSNALWQNHPCCVFVINQKVIDKCPEAVQELTNSFVKSGFYINDNSMEAARIGAQFLDQEISVVEKVLSTSENKICFDKLFPVIAELKAIQDYMHKDMGLMKDTIELDGLVNFQFATIAGAQF